jgi:hypothetical protein
MVFDGMILVMAWQAGARDAHVLATHQTRQHNAHILQAPAASAGCSRNILLLLAQSLLRWLSLQMPWQKVVMASALATVGCYGLRGGL